MKVLKQEQNKITSEYLKKYRKEFNHDYKPRFDEITPVYFLLNEDNEKVVRERKYYDPGQEKTVFEKNPVVFTQFQINSMKRMGQVIEIVTEKGLQAEAEKIKKLVAEAYERGKKDANKK